MFRMRKKNITGFTVLEVMVAVAVFSLVFVSAGNVFGAIQLAWQKQKNYSDIIREARWAMELMVRELQQSDITSVNVGMVNTRVRFNIDPDAAGPLSQREIEYIRQAGVLNRRWRTIPGGWTNPYQEAANDLALNPVFSLDAVTGVVTITLTVTKGPVSYTLESKVKPRN